MEQERDEHRLAQRQKQINLWYQSPEYKAYIEQVPKTERQSGDPKTPRVTDKRSKRSFDGMINEWKAKTQLWYVKNVGPLPVKPPPKKSAPTKKDPGPCPPDGPDPVLPGWWEDCTYFTTGSSIASLLVACVQCGSPATEMCSVCQYAVCSSKCFKSHF